MATTAVARVRSPAAWILLVLLTHHRCCAVALNVTDLGHLRWTLTNESPHPTNVSVEARLPGTVHGALRDAGVLPQDPLVGFNEQAYRWVALSNWTYTTILDISPATLADAEHGGALELILESVDTFCQVELNDRILATLDNSFVRHVVNLNTPGSSLRAGPNTLRLRFTSALTVGVYKLNAVYP
jgi:beta-galactosidase/beta-glucuronidase